MSDGDISQPHDYRVLLQTVPGLTIVGGQAVNVWAITYLDPGQLGDTAIGSRDLDVTAKVAIDQIIDALPDWKPEKAPLMSFDRRRLRLSTKAADGRLLVVEVLRSVNGLDKEDLEETVVVRDDGVDYRVLDPIALLKAKAANLRDIDQVGPPPRQDRAHLRVIAKCLAPFLSDAHAQSMESEEAQGDFARTVSRTFATLTDRKTLKTLHDEGIDPVGLLPQDLGKSSIAKVANAWKYQVPRLRDQFNKLSA